MLTVCKGLNTHCLQVALVSKLQQLLLPCRWPTSTSAALIHCCCYFLANRQCRLDWTCRSQTAASAALQPDDTGWFQELCINDAVCFNIVCDSNFLSSLTSSDPQRWKIQRSTLQTDRHWTDTTWWAVIGRKKRDLVMFSPLSRASVIQLSGQWRVDLWD